jgi:hypothetical protein
MWDATVSEKLGWRAKRSELNCSRKDAMGIGDVGDKQLDTKRAARNIYLRYASGA